MFNEVGVLKAIVRARSIAIERNPVDLEFLMSRRSVETHIFVSAWGEFTPSLKDVAMLMSLPFFGEAHSTGVTLKEKDQKKVDYLTKSLPPST